VIEKDIQAVPVEDLREKVAALEEQMLQLPQTAMLMRHHFADGLYAKELHIPAETVIVGKVHKAEHLNFLMEGEIIVFNGAGMLRLKAPSILKSEAGVKRMGITVTNTVWVTVHTVEDKEGCDLVELENKLTVCTMDDYDGYLAQATRELLGQGGES